LGNDKNRLLSHILWQFQWWPSFEAMMDLGYALHGWHFAPQGGQILVIFIAPS